ncbi:MAG: tRNA1(Val) (adenine(37)-N6)-methyltransferase [Culicoidibacterales bacterium]
MESKEMLLNEFEVLNDLLGFDNMKIIQRKDMLNFSLDSVLLAHFVSIPAKAKQIIDFGTGNGPIPLFLATRTKAKIVGLDIQEIAIDLAKRNVALNNLGDQIEMKCLDINSIEAFFPSQSADVVVSNPPFFKVSDAKQLNDNQMKTIARHEVMLTLENLISKAGYVLNNNGYFALVHRPERLLDILTLLKKYNLEPKRLQLVYPKENAEANMVLIEARKNGNSGMKICPPIIVHTATGAYQEKILKCFKRI